MEIATLEESRPGERIEYLIALLSAEILNLDLSHIRGEYTLTLYLERKE